MLKVMVVDDEMLIRKRIILGFDWEAMGYEIEDEAGDGAGALELFAQKQYDLAIVDIAMPGMNGIDLVKKIRELQYQTHIIFLTGHSDFKYAQQAIQYGVYDYILKPIHEEEFIAVLKKLHIKIEKENSRAVLFNELEKKKDYMDAVLQAKIFSDYLHDASRQDLEELIRESLGEAGICDEDAYRIILLRMDLFLKEHVEPSKQVEIVQEGCRGAIGNQPCLAVCDIYEDYMILILSSNHDGRTPIWKQKIEKLTDVLCKNTGGSVQCGISLLHSGTAQMGNAYAEAFSALNNAKILKEKTLSYQAVKDRKNIYYKIPNQELKDLQYHITKNNFKGCQEIIRRIFKEMTDRCVNFECVVMNVNRLFMEMVDAGVVSELDIRRLLNGRHGAEQVLDNMADMEEMEEWCGNVIYTLLEGEIRLSLESRSLPVVEKTCGYIRDNYRDPGMTQTQIAESMCVSPSYLSGIFKKTMGVTMVQYLTMVRMEGARELLLESEYDVKDIAEMVGYHDEYYFSRCFKRQYGLSPMQIRKFSDSRRIRT